MAVYAVDRRGAQCMKAFSASVYETFMSCEACHRRKGMPCWSARTPLQRRSIVVQAVFARLRQRQRARAPVVVVELGTRLLRRRQAGRRERAGDRGFARSFPGEFAAASTRGDDLARNGVRVAGAPPAPPPHQV